MNELNTRAQHNDIRWQLLTTASAFALVANITAVQAREEERPTVWIELGGQLERIDSEQSAFAPPFTVKTPTPEPFKSASPIAAQRLPRYAIGGEGKIVIQPKNSDWVFSAGVRYGRASSQRNHQLQTAALDTKFPNPKYFLSPTVHPTKFITESAPRLSFNKTRNQESYGIVDFQVGKDVGLGFFGSSSVIGAGVRYAAFGVKSEARITARPTAHVTRIAVSPTYAPGLYQPQTKHSEYFLAGHAQRSFHGMGPSVSWNGSAPFLGDAEEGEIAFDWGMNAAVLFGRHKASGLYEKSKFDGTKGAFGTIVNTLRYHTPVPFDRSRSVVVPNIGAFAGLSFRYSDAKVSFGYRGDYFFGAMDVGVGAQNTTTVGFHGPFAKISIGFGG